MVKDIAILGAAEGWTRVLHAAALRLRQRLPRLFFLARLSIVSGVLMLVAKVWLFVVSPDWFLLANIVFATGAVGTKMFLLYRRRSLRHATQDRREWGESTAYRRTGILIVLLSILYLLALLPSLLGTHTFLGHDLWAAIVITAVAFTELTLSIVAAFAGRGDVEPIASAIRRVNIAMALVMVALAQSALVTAFGRAGSPKGTAAAIAFGIAAGAVGVGMLGRRRSRAR